MLKIRPFVKTAEEYNWIVDLHNAVWPDHPTNLDDWTHFEKSAPSDILYRELVAEVDGERVAYVVYLEPWWYAKEPGQFFFEMFIHPHHQKGGVGKALYQFMLEDLACEEPQKISTKSREDQTVMLEFIKNLGFEQTMRFPMSRLNLADYDAQAYQGLLSKLSSSGITIQTLTSLKESDPDWKHKLYELRWEVSQDVPSPQPRQKQPFETYEKMFLGNPQLLPEANFIAVDGDEYVGFSNLWPTPGIETKLNTGLTGVVRSHRRKGIATALKVVGFDYAVALGVNLIETENEENNPMYDLNMQLGFKPCPAWLDFKKTLTAPVPCARKAQTVSSIEERVA